MIGRIVPYSQVFISLTLSLDEAAALADAVGSMKTKDEAKQKALDELGTTLEENLETAIRYNARRGT